MFKPGDIVFYKTEFLQSGFRFGIVTEVDVKNNETRIWADYDLKTYENCVKVKASLKGNFNKLCTSWWMPENEVFKTQVMNNLSAVSFFMEE